MRYPALTEHRAGQGYSTGKKNFIFVTCPSDEVKTSIQQVMTSIFYKIQWGEKNQCIVYRKLGIVLGKLQTFVYWVWQVVFPKK